MNRKRQNPAIWLANNTELWNNVGDHIEFLCPIEQVPIEVIEAAEAYAENQRKSIEQWKIIKKKGLTEQHLPMPDLSNK